MTTLTKSQVKSFGPFDGVAGDRIRVNVRYDDCCGNGHNSLGITCDIYNKGRDVGGGCNHALVVAVMPEIEHLIKWHLTSTDGPMHYVANSIYHAENGKLDYARSCAVWPDAQLEDFTKEKLLARLPALMADFKTDIESFGFNY
jgi:hypothetical protein